MGLIGDLIELASLKRTTKEMVQNGVISQEQEDEIWSSAREAGNRSFRETRQRNSQRSVGHNCCSNCEYFFWGECWYYYEGKPGFNRSQYHSFDYHGETQEIFYPDESICGNYKRDYNK